MKGCKGYLMLIDFTSPFFVDPFIHPGILACKINHPYEWVNLDQIQRVGLYNVGDSLYNKKPYWIDPEPLEPEFEGDCQFTYFIRKEDEAQKNLVITNRYIVFNWVSNVYSQGYVVPWELNISVTVEETTLSLTSPRNYPITIALSDFGKL